MASLSIISAGTMSTVQAIENCDVTQQSVLDSYSARLANLLVSNPLDTGVIEMTFSGIQALFDSDSVISLTGADMEPTLNGEPILMYTSVEVHGGDVLSMKNARSGLRCYLAVSGGFDIEPEGQRLCAGQVIPLCRKVTLYAIGKRSVPCENAFTDTFTLRLTFDTESLVDNTVSELLSRKLTVSKDSDREHIILNDVSENTASLPNLEIDVLSGACTCDGRAAGSVISADFTFLAQVRAGSVVALERVSLKEALRLERKQARRFKLLQYKFLCASWHF